MCTQLLMEHDNEYNKEQARKRERSREARSKRGDVEERAKSLAYLKTTRYDKSVAEVPPGSRPGASNDGAAKQPAAKGEDCVREGVGPQTQVV